MMLKCVLLDANIIIEAYRLGIWEKLIKNCEISVSSIVARDEALFWSKKVGGIPEPINLGKLISEGKIKEFTASADEVAAFLNKFDSVYVQGLHDGENEALALIMHSKIIDTLYCSADATAIQALAMIGHSDLGISMEALMQKSGITKRLRKHYTDKFFKTNIEVGKQNLITGQGLK
jgi:hypothetical protein